jgi:hypothetical protein
MAGTIYQLAQSNGWFASASLASTLPSEQRTGGGAAGEEPERTPEVWPKSDINFAAFRRTDVGNADGAHGSYGTAAVGSRHPTSPCSGSKKATGEMLNWPRVCHRTVPIGKLGLGTRLRPRKRIDCREAAAHCNQRKLAFTIASGKTVAAIERLARADRRLAATVDQWDADPWALNTPEGVIDLRTGKMRPPRAEDYITQITAVAPGADCPLFLAFLARITDNDASLVSYLQRVLG